MKRTHLSNQGNGFDQLSDAQTTSCSREPSLARLDSVDFLKGIALTIVLLDHIEFLAGAEYIRNWTPRGLGFSDAAEAFVFLSGLMLGWVYGPKVSSGLILPVQKRVLRRTLQIYGSYLITLAIVLLLRNWSALPLYPESEANLTIASVLLLKHQPYGFEIICLYTVILPFLPTLLALFSRYKLALIGLSLALYILVQAHPTLNLPLQNGRGWFFNPLAWQFLMVIGLVVGYRSRLEGVVVPQSQVLTIGSIAVVICGLLIKKCELFVGDQGGYLWQWGLVHLKFSSFWTSKTNLGPLRLLHCAAVFYLVYRMVSRASFGRYRLPCRPFVDCGRNSLTVYCIGIILTYISAMLLGLFGVAPVTISIVAIDACLLQFAIAYWLQRRRQGIRISTIGLRKSSS